MGGLGLQCITLVDEGFYRIAQLPFVFPFSISTAADVVDHFYIAEVVGGFVFASATVVVGTPIATALGVIGKGDAMGAFIDLYYFVLANGNLAF